MCSVSAITGYGQSLPPGSWNTGNWEPFKELVRAAEKFDADTGQPDCIDPQKQEWMDAIEKRLEKLEAEAYRRQS